MESLGYESEHSRLTPVGAELVIHGRGLRCCGVVPVGHDHRRDGSTALSRLAADHGLVRITGPELTSEEPRDFDAAA